MSVMQSIFNAPVVAGAGAKETGGWAMSLLGGLGTKAGETISPQRAMNLSAYFACLRAVSEDVGKLPLLVYRRRETRGKDRAPDHPTFRLLHDEPNPDMTSMAFRENLTHHALGWGGGFAEIARDGRGRPAALYPIHPSRVTVGRNEDREVVYQVEMDDVGMDPQIIPRRDMLHIHGLGHDGVSGYHLSVMAKEAIAMGLAAETFGASFFRNGAKLGGVIHHPAKLSDTAMTHLRESWAEKYRGAEKTGETAILEEGAKYERIGIPPEDAQFIETRQFQVEEICRWFRMPPHKVQHLLRSTFSNIESQAIEYVVDTLMPWLVRWEQELTRKLFTEQEQTRLFAEHEVAGLLRGDQSARSQFYRELFYIGVFSQNDVREKENMNPVPGGDTYYVPNNLQRSDQPQTSESSATASSIADVVTATYTGDGDDDEAGRTTATAAELPVIVCAPEPSPEPEDKPAEPEPEPAMTVEQKKKNHTRYFFDGAKLALRKESMAAERHAKKHDGDPEGFGAWLEAFYAEHRDYVVDRLTIPAEGLADAVNRGHGFEREPIETLVGAYADRHVRESRQQMMDAYEAGEVEQCCEDWTLRRPGRIATHLTDLVAATVTTSTESEDHEHEPA